MPGISKHYLLINKNALEVALSRTFRILERLRLLASQPVERRIAILLAQTAEEVGRHVQDGVELDLPDEQVSQIAGTNLFSVSRLLQRWERSGLVNKTRGRILIREGVSLEKLIQSAGKSRMGAVCRSET